MKLLNILVIMGCLLCVGTTMAQQDPNYTFYRYNMNLINPAYAGANGTELGLNIRSQWANVEGAPETQSLFFSTHMGKNVGLGVSIMNDKTFIEKATSLALDFSYKLSFGENKALYLGLKAGMNQYKADLDQLLVSGVVTDPSLSDINGGFNPNIGAGAYFKMDRFFASFSVPRLLSPDRLESDDGMVSLGADKIHMYASAGYDFILSEKLKFKPSALLRYVDSAPTSITFTAMLDIADRVEFGATYRLDEGFGGLFVFKADWLNIGYAYEASTDNPLDTAGDGTHEVFLNLKF